MLEHIQEKIETLISRYEVEKKRSEELASELQKRESEIEGYKTQITDLKRQIDNLILKSAVTGGVQTPSDARERIDRLLTEIDRCIRLLEV